MQRSWHFFTRILSLVKTNCNQQSTLWFLSSINFQHWLSHPDSDNVFHFLSLGLTGLFLLLQPLPFLEQCPSLFMCWWYLVTKKHVCLVLACVKLNFSASGTLKLFNCAVEQCYSNYGYRAAVVWLPGRWSTPKFVFSTICEYGRAFILTLSLQISYG